MIIFHTTFHLSGEVFLRGLDYLKSDYIPAAVRSGKLCNPRMMRVINEDADVNGISLSVQFSVADMDVFNDWVSQEGVALQRAIAKKFSDEVVGFSTFLEEIDL